MSLTKVTTNVLEDGAVTSAKLDTNIAIDGNLTVDTNTLYVDSTNNRVGIGIDSPEDALHAVGRIRVQGSQPRIRFYEDDVSNNNIVLKVNAGNFVVESIDDDFSTNRTERMKISSGGDISFRDTSNNEAFYWDASAARLGIGTTSPSAALDVAGGGIFTGLQVSDSNAQLSFLDSARTSFLKTVNGGRDLEITANKDITLNPTGGNVGIGTTSPQEHLHIKDSTAGDSTTIRIEGFTATGGDPIGTLEFYNTTSAPSAEVAGFIKMQSASGGRRAYEMLFGTGNVAAADAKMIIDKDGNVGIGTSNPLSKLNLEGVKNTSIITLGSTTSDSSWAEGDIIGAINFYSADGSGAGAGVKGSISFEGGPLPNTGGKTDMVFRTPDDGAGSNNVERMRIKQLGDISFRDTSANEAFYWDASASSLGLGTMNPITKLTLKGARNTNTLTFRTSDNDSGWTVGDEFGAIEFYSNDASGGGAGVKSAISCFTTSTSGANSELSFSTSSTGVNNQERMRIDSSGRVGINTTSPTAAIHAVNSSAIGESIAIFEASAAKNGYVYINADDNRRKLLVFQSGGVDKFSMGVGDSDELPTNTFFIGAGKGGGNNADFVIDSTGNVGIGTTSPTEMLTVAGNIRAVTSGETILKIRGSGDTQDLNLVSQDQTFTIRRGSTERMRINGNGRVLIGTTTEIGTVDEKLQVKNNNGGARGIAVGNSEGDSNTGAITFYNSNGIVGTIVTNGSATSYLTSSDYRLKENVVPMEGALDRVDALKPSRFNFIADADKTVDGFLAHEVAEVVPEAISGEKDAVDEDGNAIYQGIDQSKLVPLLVGAIQELKAEIETLKSQINN